MSDLCGILNINKPRGLTSRDVVDRALHTFGRVQAGHAGTLDPLASGVLIVCLGAATRLMECIHRMPKTYRTTVRLGARSDTYDALGQVVEVRARPRQRGCHSRRSGDTGRHDFPVPSALFRPESGRPACL